MAFSTGSRVQVTITPETVYGVSDWALAGDSQIIPVISNGLNLTKGSIEDPSIVSDRQKRFSRHGNKEVTGDMSVAYAHETYDAMLESVMFSTFSTNELTIGQTIVSKTMEIGHLDIAQYRKFTGVVVNSMSLEVNLDGVVQSTFGLIGKDMVISGTEQDTAPTAAPVKQPMVHFDGTLKEGGVEIGIMTGISLNIENNLNSNYALGDSSLKELTSSAMAISGELTVFFNNADLLNKFLNETSTSFEFTLNDGLTNSHTYLMNNVKYNGANIDVSNGNTLPLKIPFEALYDATNTGLKITRTA